MIIVLVVVLLLFGAKKLPDLARSLGSSAKEFRKGIGSDSSEGDTDVATDVEGEADRKVDVVVENTTDTGDDSDSGATSV